MINAFDVLSKFEKTIYDNNNFCHDVVDHFLDTIDAVVDLSDVSRGTPVVLAQDAGEKLIDLMTYLDGKTLTLSSGQVLTLKLITIDEYKVLQYLGKGVGGYVYKNLVTCRTTDYTAAWVGLSDDTNVTFADLMNTCITTASSCDIFNTAINLAYKGEFNEQNFISAISDYAINANSDVKTVINTIRYGVTGVSEEAQVTSLVNVLKQLFHGVKNAEQDPDDVTKIDFANTDITVSTSILFPIDQVITAASTVIGIITSIISPIFGAVIMAVGAAAAKAIDAIERNDDSHFSMARLAERDNDCFGVPILQNTIYASQLDTDVRNELDFKGVLKLTNGLCTMYIWYADDIQTMVNVEAFLNANADLCYNTPGVSDYLLTSILNTVVDVPNASTTVSSGTAAGLKTNIEYWIQDPTTPGADAPSFDDINRSQDPDVKDYILTRRLFLMTALFCVILIRTCYSPGQFRKYVGIDDWTEGFGYGESDHDYQVILSFLAWLYTYQNQPNIFSQYSSQLYQFIAPLVNFVLPALRRELSNSGHAPNIITYLTDFGLYSSVDVLSLASVGKWTTFVPSYGIVNKVNPGVMPPKSTVSVWARLAFAAIVVTTVIVIAMVAKTKIKRKMQFKAYQKQRELTTMAASLTSTSTQAEWNEFRKASRKYNRFLGKFTGTTFDMNNSWINYETDVVSTAATVGALSTIKDGVLSVNSYDATNNSATSHVQDDVTKIGKLISVDFS